jgi:molecular chaperone GrpE
VEAVGPPEDVPEAPIDETSLKDPRDVLDHLQRLQAEFVNYRKRVERERLETGAWAQGVLVQRLLPVLDDLRRAVESVDREDSPAAQGLRMIADKLERSLTEAGLERLSVEGAPFDPEAHEALVTLPVDQERAGTVIRELEPGYRFKGRLLRPARVQVGVERDE